MLFSSLDAAIGTWYCFRHTKRVCAPALHPQNHEQFAYFYIKSHFNF